MLDKLFIKYLNAILFPLPEMRYMKNKKIIIIMGMGVTVPILTTALTIANFSQKDNGTIYNYNKEKDGIVLVTDESVENGNVEQMGLPASFDVQGYNGFGHLDLDSINNKGFNVEVQKSYGLPSNSEHISNGDIITLSSKDGFGDFQTRYIASDLEQIPDEEDTGSISVPDDFDQELLSNLGLSKNYHIFGTNGYGKLAIDQSKFKIKIIKQGETNVDVPGLKNGDVVEISTLDDKYTINYSVIGLKKSIVIPSRKKDFSKMKKLLMHGDDYCNYVDITSSFKKWKQNKGVRIIKAIPKDENLFMVNHDLQIMQYFVDAENYAFWDTHSAKIYASKPSVSMDTALGEYDYDSLQMHINSGKMVVGNGINTSGNLSNLKLFINHNDIGEHPFDSEEVFFKNAKLNIYKNDGTLVSSNKLPDTQKLLYHEDQNELSGLLETMDLVKSGEDAAGYLFGLKLDEVYGVQATIGNSDERAKSFAKALSGYDQRSELAKRASIIKDISADALNLVSGGFGLSLKLSSLSSAVRNILKGVDFINVLSSSATSVANIAEILGDKWEWNPTQLSLVKFISGIVGLATLGRTNLIGSLIGRENSFLVSQIINFLANIPNLSLQTVQKLIKTSNKSIDDKLDQIKQFAIEVPLNNIYIPENCYYEISADYDIRLGAAYVGSIIHWFSGSYANIDTNLQHSLFAIEESNVNGYNLVKS